MSSPGPGGYQLGEAAVRTATLVLGAAILFACVSAAAAPVTVFELADPRGTQWASIFGQTFTATCDGSLSEVDFGRLAQPRYRFRLTFSVREAGPWGPLIGRPCVVETARDEDARVVASWQPGEVPLRVGRLYYVEVRGSGGFGLGQSVDRYFGGCAFFGDERFILSQPTRDLLGRIVIDARAAELSIRRLAKREGGIVIHVVNRGDTEAQIIAAGSGEAPDPGDRGDAPIAAIVPGGGEVALEVGDGDAASGWVLAFDGHQNRLANPGFEHGLSGWQVEPSPLPVGAECDVSHINPGHEQTCLRQSVQGALAGTEVRAGAGRVAVQPRGMYVLGGLYRTVGSDVVPSLVIGEEGTVAEEWLEHRRALGPAERWTAFATRFTVGPKTRRLAVVLSVRASGDETVGEVLWDALYLVPAEAPRVTTGPTELPPALVPPPAGSTARELLAFAREAMSEHEYDQADAALRGLLAEHPRAEEALAARDELAWLALRRGELKEAADRFAALMAAAPTTPQAASAAAAAMRYLPPDQAAAAWRKWEAAAERLGPEERSDTWYHRALVLASLGRADECAEGFVRAMMADPDSVLIVAFAEGLVRACDEAEAAALYARVAPNAAEAKAWTQFQKSIYQKARGDWSGVLETLRELVASGRNLSVEPAANFQLRAAALEIGKMWESRGHYAAASPVLESGLRAAMPANVNPALVKAFNRLEPQCVYEFAGTLSYGAACSRERLELASKGALLHLGDRHAAGAVRALVRL